MKLMQRRFERPSQANISRRVSRIACTWRRNCISFN